MPSSFEIRIFIGEQPPSSADGVGSTPMDIVLLQNKNSGAGHPSRKELIGMVREAGHKVRYHELHAALDDPGVLERGDFVAVAGGDGSVRKVARQLLESAQKRCAVLPLGTANN